MKVKAKIRKWGNGLAIRISGPIRDIPNFEENTMVNIEINQNGFTATKIKEDYTNFTLPFSETELLKDMTPRKAHSDGLAHLLDEEF